jgi:hypothetical protein
VAYKVLREIRKDLPRFCGRQIAVTVHPQVAEVLLGRARKAVTALGEELGREIEVRARTGQHQEQFEVNALDEGPPVALALPWLTESKPATRQGGRGSRKQAAAEEPAEAAAPEAEPAEAPEPPADPVAEPEPLAAAPEPEPEPEPEGVEEEPPEGEKPDAAPALEPLTDAVPPVALAAEPEAAARPEILDAEEEKPILRRSELEEQ